MSKISPKVIASVVAAAVSVLVALGVNVDPALESSVVVLLVAVAGYLTPDSTSR